MGSSLLLFALEAAQKSNQMAKLTKAQINFINEMKLNINDLFDATGLKASDWKIQMKALGKLVAFGVTPCLQYGHTLRTRAGHCLQCNTANLSYLKRMSESADVYVCWSKISQIAKIGLSKDSYKRVESLNYFEYGGANDWELKLIYVCDNAGEVESKAHKILSAYSKMGVSYMNVNVERFCTEIFKCTLEQAMDALEEAVK
jgi:hypothetical protein